MQIIAGYFIPLYMIWYVYKSYPNDSLFGQISPQALLEEKYTKKNWNELLYKLKLAYA